MRIVLAQQGHCHHDIINVLEDKGTAFPVLRFGFDEGDGVVSPVAARVEVVGSVVTVIEAVAVRL